MRSKHLSWCFALAMLGATTGACSCAEHRQRKAPLAAEIDFWHSFTQPARIKAMEDIAAKFEAETNTEVNIGVVPWNKVNEKWTSAVAAKALPDVSICLPAVCIAMYEAGVSRPLDEAVELIGGTDKFASADLLANFHTYKGQLISLPFYNHARLLFYRKDILDELGLEPPSTWEEYIEVAAKATKAPDRYGMIQMWDPGDTGATQYLYLFMRSNGGAYLDAEGNATFNRSENVEAVKQLLELYKAGSPESEVSLGYHGNVFDLFASGKTVMVFDTMFVTDAMKGKRPDLYESGAVGVARPPSRKQDAWYVGDVGITAMKGDNEEAADNWIAYLYQDENYIPFLHTIAGGMYPATKSVANNPVFFEADNIKKFEEGAKLTLEGVAKGSDIGLTNGLNPFAAAVYGSGIIENMMQDIAINGTDVETAVAEAHNQIQETVERARRR